MNILDQLAGLKIIVVGDVMLDRYWWGTVERISPEAPVPIIQLETMTMTAGGAANVAANVAGLGAVPYLFGVKGDDDAGELLTASLADAGIEHHLVTSAPGRKTTCKTRIVAHNQHVVRIDQESTTAIDDSFSDTILDHLTAEISTADAVIVSDYAKGMLSDYFLSKLIAEATARDKLLVVDPKGRDFSRYRGASVVTPNRREAGEACSLDLTSRDLVRSSGQKLMEDLDLKGLLITEGEHGMTIFENGRDPVHLSSLARNVYDVTGAGDTVIAAFTAAAAAGNDLITSARLANAAAGIVVGEIGTTRITGDMLTSYLTSAENGHVFESLHA